MSDPHAEAPALEELREKVDAIDHELLRLLARRRAVVEEISAWKLPRAEPIQDVLRERDLLADRLAHAGRLGLEPGMVTALFELVLRASREHQAALRGERA